MTHMDPVPQHHPGEYVPRTRLPRGYPQRISCHPASEERDWRLPKLSPACGQGKSFEPSQLGDASAGSKPVSGFGWKRFLVRGAAAKGWVLGTGGHGRALPGLGVVKREFHMGMDGKNGKFRVSCREISNTQTLLAVANPPHLQEIVLIINYAS